MAKWSWQGWQSLVAAVKQRIIPLGIMGLLSLFSLGLVPVAAEIWTSPANVHMQLVSEVQTIQPGTPFSVALRLKIRPQWHVYWQNPGDSGAPPRLIWTLPKGFTASELVFPYPQRLPIAPLLNFGYETEVYLLSQLTPSVQSVTSPVTLQAKAEVLVCKRECIPETANLTLTLPVANREPVVHVAQTVAFHQTRQSLPQPLPWASRFQLNETHLILQVDLPPDQVQTLEQSEFFPYTDGLIRNASPQNAVRDQGKLTLTVERGPEASIDRVDGVLVMRFRSAGTAITRAFVVQANPGEITIPTMASPPDSLTETSLGQALLLALAGGMILNLMPCVFPVLSLKALNIAQQGQHSAWQSRLHGLVFTAGVLTSFAIMAGVLLVLRSMGQQIGWGFQLQSPVVVLLLTYVLFAVALSLSGAFTVGGAIMGLGLGLTAKPGYAGEFFTGVLATVMATPCTAPFMATAISVALTQPVGGAIAILLMLGLGLALPYLTLSFTPALRQFLPKPGAWMETLQQVLAFPVYAAAGWLVWVLTQQTGPNGLAIALGGCILISFAAWLHQKTHLSRQLWRRIGRVGALGTMAIALSFAPIVAKLSVPIPGQVTITAQTWRPYTAATLESLRQSGQPVFFNFTAAWCITCLVNEQVALSQPDVNQAFQSKGVTLVKADWTNQNPLITNALSKFGRSGVPLYVLYPQGFERGDPVVLPSVLTPQIVQDALKKI